jgi:hypothetical protein
VSNSRAKSGIGHHAPTEGGNVHAATPSPHGVAHRLGQFTMPIRVTSPRVGGCRGHLVVPEQRQRGVSVAGVSAERSGRCSASAGALN